MNKSEILVGGVRSPFYIFIPEEWRPDTTYDTTYTTYKDLHHYSG